MTISPTESGDKAMISSVTTASQHTIAHEIKDRKVKEARKALLTVYPLTEGNVFAAPPLQTHTHRTGTASSR